MTHRFVSLMSALAVCVAMGAGAASFAPAGQRAWLYIVAALLLGAVMTASTVHAWMRWTKWTGAERSRFVSIAFAGGLVARLVLVPVSPFTTHDVDRYLWDGSVLAAGQDPWRVPPNDPSLSALTTRFRAPPENAHIPTIYPPAAVALFALVSKAGPPVAPWLWKLIVALASVALLWVTRRLLEREDRLLYLPLIAFSPLALLESGIGAHLDILCAVLVAAALLQFKQRRAVATGLLLGAAAALKLLPAAAALPLFIALAGKRERAAAAAQERGAPSAHVSDAHVAAADGPAAHRLAANGSIANGTPENGRPGPASSAHGGAAEPRSADAPAALASIQAQSEVRAAAKFAAAFALFPALSYGGAFLFGFVPIGSLSFFFEKWRFGSLVFPLLEPVIGEGARVVALGLGALCVGYAGLIARRDVLRATSWAMAGPLLASPVVFPWYLLPFSAGLAARPSAFAFSVLLAAPLTYEVVDRFDVDTSWAPATWPLVTIAVAMASAFGVDVWRRRAR